MDKSLVRQPELPAINITSLEHLLEHGDIISLDGEILPAVDGDDTSLVAWIIAAKRLRDISRRMEELTSSIMLERCRENAGPIHTEYGTAKESISRGSVSGVAAKQIRSILDEAADRGVITADTVDNLAPLTPHVTPAKLADYVDAISGKHADLAADLENLIPEKRRVCKVDEALV
ncbi:MAG: hypothetical protein ACO24S_06960 [Ilumatobacteraceae bacterium]